MLKASLFQNLSSARSFVLVFSSVSVYIVVLLSLLALAMTGCDPDWPSHGKSSRVVGEVTLNDQPLVDARVVFLPKAMRINGLFVPSSFGTTDAQGVFKLKTGYDNELIPFGDYTVLISKMVEVSSNDNTGDDASDDRVRREVVPGQYNRHSILTYELSTQEAFDRPSFELTSE
jgi:hypothetical protein